LKNKEKLKFTDGGTCLEVTIYFQFTLSYTIKVPEVGGDESPFDAITIPIVDPHSSDDDGIFSSNVVDVG
jgi:hypothetical protein